MTGRVKMSKAPVLRRLPSSVRVAAVLDAVYSDAAIGPVKLVDCPVVAHAEAELAAITGAGQRAMAHRFCILRHAGKGNAHLLCWPLRPTWTSPFRRFP